MEERKHIVILAAGEFPTHPVSLRALREADFVVCCDSAYAAWQAECTDWQAYAAGNYVVVGDGDSLIADMQTGLGSRYVHVAEQDYNDLVKAMRWVVDNLPLDGADITLLGATGRREDHTIANISHLATFATWWPQLAHKLQMLTNYGRFSIVCGERRYSSFPGQQVSLFAMDPANPVSVSGLQYPVQGRRFTALWQGSLNAATGTEFSVNGQNVIVYQTYEPKE